MNKQPFLSSIAVNGGWSDWTEHAGRCSVTCGYGKQIVNRKRQCNKPLPQHGGKQCEGKPTNTTTEICQTSVKCPGKMAMILFLKKNNNNNNYAGYDFVSVEKNKNHN